MDFNHARRNIRHSARIAVSAAIEGGECDRVVERVIREALGRS